MKKKGMKSMKLKKLLAGMITTLALTVCSAGSVFADVDHDEWYNYYNSTNVQSKNTVCTLTYKYNRTYTLTQETLTGTAVGKLDLTTPYGGTQLNVRSVILSGAGQSKTAIGLGPCTMAGYTDKARFYVQLQFNSGSGTANSSGAIDY
ncbi:MAG: hypothetical protein IJA34_02845 [Lachnospiraceae bacterium]|nr:hypothetical protein [Lachnospiraceae bacterium]